MKKLFLFLAVLMAVSMTAGTAMAVPFNDRPVTDALLTGTHPIGEQLLGGDGGVFDSIGATTYAADPFGTQSSAAIFTNEAGGGSVASYIISIAGNAASNTSGLYSYGDSSYLAPIFNGAVAGPIQATVAFGADGTVQVTQTYGTGGVVNGTYTNFGNEFGFYLQDPDANLFYSEDDINAGGNPQALIYQGNNSDVITVPGFMGGTFTDDEWIIAFEDLAYAGSDKDFNDLVYIVESIQPIPEPATLFLLGSGLVGLAGIGRKKIKRS